MSAFAKDSADDSAKAAPRPAAIRLHRLGVFDQAEAVENCGFSNALVRQTSFCACATRAGSSKISSAR